MNIFNSLGSNYTFTYVIESLFSTQARPCEKLIKYLENAYDGKATLFYKGREALTAALETLNIPDDSYIAINGFTCVAVFNAIRKAGLEPLCLDLTEGEGLNFTPEELSKAIKNNKKIKAVVIQNTLGFTCDIEKIEALCKKHKLILIEDLAHSIGARYKDGRKAGTVGDFVILSFSQDKIIDAVSGGALVTRNPTFKVKSSRLRNKRRTFSKDKLYPLFTWTIRQTYPIGLGKILHFILKMSRNLPNIMDESLYDLYPLPHWNASRTLHQFNVLEKQLDHRQKIATIYAENLPDLLCMFDKKKTVQEIEYSANLRFPIFVKNREKLVNKLKKSGVYVSDIWYKDVAPESPNAINDSRLILNLPTHIHVSDKNAFDICRIINLWLEHEK